jgi:hypothetical protein
MPLVVAQSLVEYSGISSNSTLTQSIGAVLSNFWDGLRGVDQNAWYAIGGVVLVLAFLTRRSRRQ